MWFHHLREMAQIFDTGDLIVLFSIVDHDPLTPLFATTPLSIAAFVSNFLQPRVVATAIAILFSVIYWRGSVGNRMVKPQIQWLIIVANFETLTDENFILNSTFARSGI